jgi:hypothetical protein
MSNEGILDDSEVCDIYSEPVFFYGAPETECPNCGQTYKPGEEL